MIEKTKVLITVKTYPTLSAKYDELVCTAGITEKGKWMRIYPVPFRKLKWEQQYKKYQWIELDVIKNKKKDFRPESYNPINGGKSIKVKKQVKNWEERKRIVFKENIFTNMKELITKSKDKNTYTSLAIFKPTEILDFTAESTEKEWDAEKIKRIKDRSKQLKLFDSDTPDKFFEIVKKLPYKFSYVFKDEKGNPSKLMVEDWETGMLYWNCLKKETSEEKAIQKIKQKYFERFTKTDLHLFLGTTLQHHRYAKNPFIIIGVFTPPKNDQMPLF